MKKSLSLVLAAVLAFGGAVSAFAAITGGIGKPENVTFIQPASSAYVWSSTNGKFEYTTTLAGFEYGDTFGFLLGVGSTPAQTTDDVKNLKAYPEYNMTDSKNLVEKTNIEYKKYDDAGVNKYAYFATIKTKANNTAALNDLMGTMYVGKSSTDAKGKTGYSFGYQLDNGLQQSGSSYTVDGNPTVLSFTGQGDVDITFTSTTGNDQATFTVDATGQSKLNCGYTVKYNAEFAAKYPEANLEFISWPANPSFNRIGDLQIYADPDTYLYQLTEDGFKEVSAKYDETYEAFMIKTRTLGAYVVSDIELEAEVIDEVPVSSAPGTNPPTGGVVEVPNNGGKPNPNTGR